MGSRSCSWHAKGCSSRPWRHWSSSLKGVWSALQLLRRHAAAAVCVSASARWKLSSAPVPRVITRSRGVRRVHSEGERRRRMRRSCGCCLLLLLLLEGADSSGMDDCGSVADERRRRSRSCHSRRSKMWVWMMRMVLRWCYRNATSVTYITDDLALSFSIGLNSTHPELFLQILRPSCELSLVLRRVVGRRSWCLLLSRGLVMSWRLHLTYRD